MTELASNERHRSPSTMQSRQRSAATAAYLASGLLLALLVTVAVSTPVAIALLVISMIIAGTGGWWLVTGSATVTRLGVVVAVLGGALSAVALVGLASEPKGAVALMVALALFVFALSRALSVPATYRRGQETRRRARPVRTRPSVPLRRVTVPCALIVNEGAGSGKAAVLHMDDHASELGIDVHLLHPGADLKELAERVVRAGAQRVGIAGGDGSLGPVAGVCRRHGVPFAVIPTGTRNHFARDLGLDRSDPLGALAAFDGREIEVDTATVDGRTFLNNVAFGVYAEMVHEPTYRDAKLATAQRVTKEILKGARPPARVSFEDPSGRCFERVFLLLVAVGEYQFANLTAFGVRDSLTSGVLQITVLEPPEIGPVQTLPTATVLRELQRNDGFWQWTSTAFALDSTEEHLKAGLDGEAVEMEPHAEIKLEPRSLRVLVPRHLESVPGRRGRGPSPTIADLVRLAADTAH